MENACKDVLKRELSRFEISKMSLCRISAKDGREICLECNVLIHDLGRNSEEQAKERSLSREVRV